MNHERENTHSDWPDTSPVALGIRIASIDAHACEGACNQHPCLAPDNPADSSSSRAAASARGIIIDNGPHCCFPLPRVSLPLCPALISGITRSLIRQAFVFPSRSPRLLYRDVSSVSGGEWVTEIALLPEYLGLFVRL